jgi:hypothetical protein
LKPFANAIGKGGTVMFRKLTLALLTIAMLLTLVSASGFIQTAEASAWQSSASYANAPYFHGVIRITVPAGTIVNLRAGLYRTLAHDVYDGDITRHIVMPANTSITSNTAVTYSVTNSRGQTATQQVQITFSGSSFVVERRIFSLPRADTEASEIADMRRGNNHDAQHLGIYMPPNSAFQARILSGPVNQDLTLTAYTGIAGQNISTTLNRSGTQTAVSHGGGVIGHGQTVSAMGRVPMIKTPKNDTGHSVVELTFNLSGANSVRGLNYFHHGDDQTTFMNGWTNDHMFSIIEGRAITIMVPWNDRNELTGNPVRDAHERMTSINEILGFYDHMVDMYDDWTGLSIDSAQRHNRLIRSRFLALPQFGGIGWAYYSGDHIALSNGTGTISGKPLNGGHTVFPYLLKSWAALHEVGHGYEGNITGKEYPLGEISNNILSNFYQRDFITANPRYMWFYDLGNSNATHPALENRTIANRMPNFSADFRNGLFMLTEFLDTTGKPHEVWAEIHRLNRGMMAAGQNWPLADLFARAAFDVTGLNMLPYLQWIGFQPSVSIQAYVFEREGRIPYFLRQLTATDASADSIRTAEGLRGRHAGALPNPARGINGSVTINITIDQLSRLTGQHIRIMDGPVAVQTAEINSGTVTFNNIPAGAYYIDMPGAAAGSYTTGYNALIVRAGASNTAAVTYSPAASIVAASAQIRFLGGSDVLFSIISYDPVRSVVTVNTRPVSPHWVTTLANPYATVTVNGSPVITRSYHPTNSNTAQIQESAVQIGTTVVVSHIEGSTQMNSRGRLFNSLNNQTILGFRDATFVVTQYGLVLQTWPEAQRYADYLARFNNYLASVRSSMPPADIANQNKFKDIKAQIIASSALLNASDRASFESTNQDLIQGDPNVQPPTITTDLPSAAVLDEYTNSVTLTIAAVSPNGGAISYQWFRNGTAITGATGTAFTATQTGNYHVVVTNNRNGSIGTRSSTLCNVAAPAEVTITQLGDAIVSVGANNAAVLANFRGMANGIAVPLQVNGDVDFNRAGTYSVTITPAAGRGSLAAQVRVVPQAVYAGDFGWASNSTTAWSVITADFGIEPAGSPILLTGTGGAVLEYRKGVFAHANSNVVFDIAGKGFTVFRSYAGINRLANAPRTTTGTTVFEVFVDGESRFASSPMNGSSSAVFVEVDITGANRVELRASATSNGSAHSAWADAMFISGSNLPPPVWGDVNGDGDITAADVTLLRGYIAAQDKAVWRAENPNFNPVNADANGDGFINSADVTLIRRWIAATDKSSVKLGPQ